MQAVYLSVAMNELTGMLPVYWQALQVLDASSNHFVYAYLKYTSMYSQDLKLLYLGNNSLAGTLPASGLAANLTLLDVSYNNFSGPLPQALPMGLSVLNVSHNSLSGSLPSNWSVLQQMGEVRLDDNSFTGQVPASWASWGNNTGNSLQLSIINTSLQGQVPRQWVEQFCLAIFSSDSNAKARQLFNPIQLLIEALGITQFFGPSINLPVQQASINVTLGGKLLAFDYGSPGSICGIPNAARNVGLIFGIFAALLLGTLVAIKVWQKRQPTSVSTGFFAKLRAIPTLPHHSKLHGVRLLLERIWFFVSDVMYFVYSQVTDAIAIHQVFESGQLRYAYLLLGILLLPFAFMFLLSVRVSVTASADLISGRNCLHKTVAILIGLVLSPVIFLLLEHGLGLPLPNWFNILHVDISTFYRVQSLAKTFLNALLQAAVQTKLYLMGNDPNGVHVYIDTRLYLNSMAGSLSSLLKSIALLMIELHQRRSTLVAYFGKLVKFEAFEAHTEFVGPIEGHITRT